MRPQTRYARSAGDYVAYQVFGDGPRDILFVTSWATNVDAMWEDPSLTQFFRRLGRLGRVICLFAATFPDRVARLVLLNTFARWRRAPDFPVGMPDATTERLVDAYERSWGQDARMLRRTAPSLVGDARAEEWFTRYQRLAMPPGAATKMYRWVTRLDVRAVLPTISAPTLVLHRQENEHYRAGHGDFLAEQIPGARLVRLPGADAFPFYTAASADVLDEIQAFLTGVREEMSTERELATVLFTDIVGSTELAARLGDARWLELRTAHDEVVRRHLATYGGREVKTTGDGFLATFDGPARAVRCAVQVRDAVRWLGLQIRAGLHTGEIERLAGDVGGVAVHLAARIMAAAAPGEVVVSRVLPDLVVGSGIEFDDLGPAEVKGIPGRWQLCRVEQVP